MKRAKFVFIALAAVLALPSCSYAKVRIRFAHWDSNPFILSVVKSFNASQSKYEVVYEIADLSKLMVTLAAGSAPSVFTSAWCGALGMMMDKGMLCDLSPYIKRDRIEMGIDDFSKPLLEAGMSKGKTYAIPFEEIGTNCVWYNKDLYKECGLSDPSEDWTVQTVLSNALKLTKDANGDGKLDQAGFIPLGGWYEARIASMVLGGGGFFYSSDRKSWVGNSQENIKGLGFVESLIKKSRVTADGAAFGGWTDFFGRGKTGMWVRDACLTALVTTTGSKWRFDIAPPPILDGTMKRARQDAQGTYVVMPKSVKRNEAEGAWAFIKYWTSEEGVKAMWRSQGWIQRPLPRATLSEKYFLHPNDAKYSAMRLANFLKYKDTVTASENWPYVKFDRASQLLQDGWTRVVVGKNGAEAFLNEVTPSMKKLLAQK